MKDILYGKDNTEGIVGVVTHDDESVLIYVRKDDGSVRPYVQKYWSMFVTTEEGAKVARTFHEPEWKSGRHKCVKLEDHEHGFFTHLILSKSRKNNRGLRKEVISSDNKVLDLGTAPTQYLLQTGRTLMKGLNTATVRRLQIDIETMSFDGQFPNAEKDSDEIFIVALSDNHGWRQVLHTSKDPNAYEDETYVRCADEQSLLRATIKAILLRDPDIIENHNIFGFDLPYLRDRCKKHEVPFSLGRNGKAPMTRKECTIKFAERDIDYENFNIAGRHVIDTYFLVCEFDVYKRAMPSYSLKEAAKFFDLARKDRVYIPGDKLTETWFEDPNRVLEYALDDVDEARMLSDKLLPSTFAMAQMVPNQLQKLHTGGVSGAIELLFFREYIRNKVAIPKGTYGKQLFGGLTSAVRTGRVKKLWYIDVASLYPSIMLNFEVQPRSDKLLLFQRLLRLCTELRLDTKKRMNDELEANGESDLYVSLDAEQASYKKFINSFYGYLGFKEGRFNDVGEADRVATTGQSILVRMIEVCEKLGCTLIECDTDGILVQPPEGREEDDAYKFVKEEVEPKMPKGIKLDLDGVFEYMLSYKAKNYALINAKGKVKIKGGAFKNRGIEPFARNFMKKAIGWMLNGEWEKIHDEYVHVRRRIASKDLRLEEFAVRKNLKKTLDEYEESLKINGGKANAQAQYEVWKRNPDAYSAGDAITYYFKRSTTRRSKKVIGFLDATDITEYVSGTENSEHYLRRFDEVIEKFRGFFDEPTANLIFERKKRPTEQELFPLVINWMEQDIVTPVQQIKTIADLKSEMQLNLKKYANYYS